MPKHQIFHKAGEPLAEEVKSLVEKYFSRKEAERLERLGGRIQISLAAPYKPKKKEIQVIDNEFIEKLKLIRKDTNLLKETFDGLTVKQLKEICNILGQPIRSNAVGEEIKQELIKNLQSEDFWQRISAESPKNK